MTDEVRSLIDALRKGDFEDPDDKIELLAAALQENGGVDTEVLLKLLASPQAVLRRAALLASRGRKELPILERLRQAADDEDPRVREALAKALNPPPDSSFVTLLTQLCRDRVSGVQAAALKAKCSALQPVRSELLLSSTDCRVREAAAESLEVQPQVVATFFRALARDGDDDVLEVCANALERALQRNSRMVANKAPEELQVLEKAEKQLVRIGEGYPLLLKFLQERTAAEISPEELAQFGTNLAAAAREGTLPRPNGIDSIRQRVTEELFGERPRSIVILGEPGVGKTALVNDLAYWASRPENGGWQILRMSPTDFVVGTLYIGEWETRVANLIKAIRRPRRVLLYIPNIGELPGVGKHSKGEHNVLTALAPSIQDGSLLIVGESTVAEFERGFRRLPAARAYFKTFLLDQPSVPGTAAILQHLRDASASSVSDGQIEQMIELADQFVPGEVRPGNAVRLFESVQSVEARTKEPILTRHILEALASSTGLPADLLDDDVPLDLAHVRSFFESRVLGQTEAVNAVVELVTLIKAGLTDPMKPMGVFLFVGPTGVGKTEMARALAEFIFGNAGRLLRFDMSEYATPDGFQRLLNSELRGSLTNLVRQTPLSVVLLDEIEKSNVNVFDLCLQLFDAGRLTDDLGRTTDFRKCILILTSNVGAAKATFSPIGFKQHSAGAEPDKEGTFRELSHFFRPEFLNRFDRIVYFRPLELQVAEGIARKEIKRVLGRTGIKRRKIVVEVDPTVLGILLKEGYSPAFGARPLKRAVEKLLLLPVARIIASGKCKETSLLRLQAVDGRIEPQLIRQETSPRAAQTEAGDPRDLRERTMDLQERLSSLGSQTTSLVNRKEALLTETQEEGFYKNATRTAAVFDEIHRLDQFLSFVARTNSALLDYQNHLARSGKGSKTQLEARFRELKRQVWCIQTIAEQSGPHGAMDALVEISLVSQDGEPIDALRTLAEAYLAYIERLPLVGEVIAKGASTPAIYLRVSGTGACALLASEAGLHEFTRTSRVKLPRTGREVEKTDKELLRVTIWPARECDEPNRLDSKSEPAKGSSTRLLSGTRQSVSLFDPKIARSLSVIARGQKADATAHAALILASQREQPAEDGLGLVRRYEFGIGSRALDLRTGANTPHLDRLFKGHFDLLVMNA